MLCRRWSAPQLVHPPQPAARRPAILGSMRQRALPSSGDSLVWQTLVHAGQRQESGSGMQGYAITSQQHRSMPCMMHCACHMTRVNDCVLAAEAQEAYIVVGTHAAFLRHGLLRSGSTDNFWLSVHATAADDACRALQLRIGQRRERFASAGRYCL